MHLQFLIAVVVHRLRSLASQACSAVSKNQPSVADLLHLSLTVDVLLLQFLIADAVHQLLFLIADAVHQLLQFLTVVALHLFLTVVAASPAVMVVALRPAVATAVLFAASLL